MGLVDDLLSTLPDGSVRDLRVGAFWTAVVVEVAGHRQCGLASTLHRDDHHHGGGPAVRDAGWLAKLNARQLAELARSYRPMETAIGIATINALLPVKDELWIDRNAEEVIAQYGAGKKVLLLGPSTPLSPILFDYGVHLLSGSVVEDIEAVLQAVSQGANFQQVHRQGVRLVTMQKDQLKQARPPLRGRSWHSQVSHSPKWQGF